MAGRKPKPEDEPPEDPIFIWDIERPDNPVPEWLRGVLDQAERDYQEMLRRQQATDMESEDA